MYHPRFHPMVVGVVPATRTGPEVAHVESSDLLLQHLKVTTLGW